MYLAFVNFCKIIGTFNFALDKVEAKGSKVSDCGQQSSVVINLFSCGIVCFLWKISMWLGSQNEPYSLFPFTLMESTYYKVTETSVLKISNTSASSNSLPVCPSLVGLFGSTLVYIYVFLKHCFCSVNVWLW